MGWLQRPERVIILGVGLLLPRPGPLAVLAVLALLTQVTVLQRILHVRRLTAEPGRERLSVAPSAGRGGPKCPGRGAEDDRETHITLRLDLDGERRRARWIRGVPFFDHMLDQLARHAPLDLTLHCRGDLQVDTHHTVEDCALLLGRALHQALGDRRGIRRMADARVPMDEALAEVAIDLSGRPFCRAEVADAGSTGLPPSLVAHFLESFAAEGAPDAARPRPLRAGRPPPGRGHLQGPRPGPGRGRGARSPPGGRRPHHQGHPHRVGRLPQGVRRLRSRGKRVASRTLASPARRATQRSRPMAKPPCGGIPCRNASR